MTCFALHAEWSDDIPVKQDANDTPLDDAVPREQDERTDDETPPEVP